MPYNFDRKAKPVPITPRQRERSANNFTGCILYGLFAVSLGLSVGINQPILAFAAMIFLVAATLIVVEVH